MQLLVSVRNEIEAVAAVAGGADIIDAKEPLAGALGAVSSEVLRAIVAATAIQSPHSANCDDAGCRGAGVDRVGLTQQWLRPSTAHSAVAAT